MRKTIIHILVLVLLSFGVQANDFTSAGVDAGANLQPNEQPDDLFAQAEPGIRRIPIDDHQRKTEKNQERHREPRQ